MRITRMTAVVGAFALAMAAAACGGDDGGSDAGSGSSTSGIVGKAETDKKLVFGVKADQPGLGLFSSGRPAQSRQRRSQQRRPRSRRARQGDEHGLRRAARTER